MPYVRGWHAHFLAVIGTKEWLVTEGDFLFAHDRVRHLEGEGVLESLMDVVSIDLQPSDLLQGLGIDGRCWVLLQLCYHAAKRNVDRTFFLSARYAAKLSGMSAGSANSVLRLLVRRGMLEELAKGGLATRKASEYRWVGPDSIYANAEAGTPTQRRVSPSNFG